MEDVISIEESLATPVPIRTKSLQIHTGNGLDVTTIVRWWEHTEGWRDGTAKGRCRLCRRCTVDNHGVCMISIDRLIPKEDCPTFSREAWESMGADELRTDEILDARLLLVR